MSSRFGCSFAANTESESALADFQKDNDSNDHDHCQQHAKGNDATHLVILNHLIKTDSAAWNTGGDTDKDDQDWSRFRYLAQ